MSCGVGCRRGSDPALLWLWRRPVATTPIQPLAWEPPYAAGAAQEIAKSQKKKILLYEETCGCLMGEGGSGRDRELGLIRHNLDLQGDPAE